MSALIPGSQTMFVVQAMPESSFSHLDEQGKARMVDVGAKAISQRTAVAKSRIRMDLATADAIRASEIAKGDVLGVARLAGIQAAKQTAGLIPLCHVLPLEAVNLTLAWVEPNLLEWTAEVKAMAKTGVEMEALVAASIASLTVYDMCKSLDPAMEVVHVGLWWKDGGKRGRFERSDLNG
jgi:cyclic pyranopterin phosphate synthase